MLHTPTLEKVQELGLAAWPQPKQRVAPRFDEVQLRETPKSITDLFSNKQHVESPNWYEGLGENGDLAIYLNGLPRVRQFTKQPHPKHLKKFGDKSLLQGRFDHYEIWSEEAACDLLCQVSGDRLSRVRPNIATSLRVAIRYSVALSLYLQSAENTSGPSNSLWAFQEISYEPAIFGIEGLNKDRLNGIRNRVPNFDKIISSFCGQRDGYFATQCAEGYTLTHKTALLLKAILENLELPESLRIGDVRISMGAKSGKTIAALNEMVEPGRVLDPVGSR